MTMQRQYDRERRDWRCRLHRLVRRFNALLAAAVLALVLALVLPSVANAAPTCPNGGQPDGRGRCVYQPSGMTCAWPARIVRIGRVALCVKWGQVER